MQPFVDDDVHHAQREGRVGSGHRPDVPVGLGRRARLQRVDDHQGRARLFCLADEGPEVQIRHHRVRAPEDDEAAARYVFREHSRIAAEGSRDSDAGRAATYGALKLRRAKAGEETPVNRAALNQAQGSHRAVWHDSRRAVALDDTLQASGDVSEGVVPAYTLELAFALLPDAAHRI